MHFGDTTSLLFPGLQGKENTYQSCKIADFVILLTANKKAGRQFLRPFCIGLLSENIIPPAT